MRESLGYSESLAHLYLQQTVDEVNGCNDYNDFYFKFLISVNNSTMFLLNESG